MTIIQSYKIMIGKQLNVDPIHVLFIKFNSIITKKAPINQT